MAELTAKEMAWIRKVQKLLDSCPSDRIEFYTVGDYNVFLFDAGMTAQVNEEMDRRGDFGPAVDAVDACFNADLTLPNQVHSVAG